MDGFLPASSVPRRLSDIYSLLASKFLVPMRVPPEA